MPGCGSLPQMKSVLLKSVLPLFLLLPLTACSRPDISAEQAARMQALEARITTLETQVSALKKAQAARPLGAQADTSQQATARAAAQYCATQLASALEEYRQDNARYPAVSAVTLPSACQGFRVAWTGLEKAHYRFQVSGQSGGVLTSEVR